MEGIEQYDSNKINKDYLETNLNQFTQGIIIATKPYKLQSDPELTFITPHSHIPVNAIKSIHIGQEIESRHAKYRDTGIVITYSSSKNPNETLIIQDQNIKLLHGVGYCFKYLIDKQSYCKRTSNSALLESLSEQQGSVGITQLKHSLDTYKLYVADSNILLKGDPKEIVLSEFMASLFYIKKIDDLLSRLTSSKHLSSMEFQKFVSIIQQETTITDGQIKQLIANYSDNEYGYISTPLDKSKEPYREVFTMTYNYFTYQRFIEESNKRSQSIMISLLNSKILSKIGFFRYMCSFDNICYQYKEPRLVMDAPINMFGCYAISDPFYDKDSNSLSPHKFEELVITGVRYINIEICDPDTIISHEKKLSIKIALESISKCAFKDCSLPFYIRLCDFYQKNDHITKVYNEKIVNCFGRENIITYPLLNKNSHQYKIGDCTKKFIILKESYVEDIEKDVKDDKTVEENESGEEEMKNINEKENILPTQEYQQIMDEVLHPPKPFEVGLNIIASVNQFQQSEISSLLEKHSKDIFIARFVTNFNPLYFWKRGVQIIETSQYTFPALFQQIYTNLYGIEGYAPISPVNNNSKDIVLELYGISMVSGLPQENLLDRPAIDKDLKAKSKLLKDKLIIYVSAPSLDDPELAWHQIIAEISYYANVGFENTVIKIKAPEAGFIFLGIAYKGNELYRSILAVDLLRKGIRCIELYDKLNRKLAHSQLIAKIE